MSDSIEAYQYQSDLQEPIEYLPIYSNFRFWGALISCIPAGVLCYLSSYVTTEPEFKSGTRFIVVVLTILFWLCIVHSLVISFLTQRRRIIPASSQSIFKFTYPSNNRIIAIISMIILILFTILTASYFLFSFIHMCSDVSAYRRREPSDSDAIYSLDIALWAMSWIIGLIATILNAIGTYCEIQGFLHKDTSTNQYGTSSNYQSHV